MTISKIEIFTFDVPFKVVFRHASASRSHTQNIIVSITASDGLVGYGEGCPREYVTGETIASAHGYIQSISTTFIEKVISIDTLRIWIENNKTDIDQNPSAFCALELALLDLFGKLEGKSIEQVLGLPALTGTIVYSAILGDSPLPIYALQLWRYLRGGFQDFKIKLSGNVRRDRWKCRLLKFMGGDNLRVRFDANNLWSDASGCTEYIKQLQIPIYAMEEPLKANDLSGFSEVSNQCNLPIILDESLLNIDQLDDLDPSGKWLINLRISKMGGIIRSLELAAKAKQLGIGIIIGAQVGETSILTRAAISVANCHKQNLVASEGAFGTILLKNDLTTPCLMFGHGGKLDLSSLSNEDTYGMGLYVDQNLLKPAPKTI